MLRGQSLFLSLVLGLVLWPPFATTRLIAQEKTGDATGGDQEKLENWRKAAENGEPWAAFNLGLAYQTGLNVEKNEIEAIRWYRAAADHGYSPAQANLGYCYETGIGVPVNFVEAVKWYQMAALQGHALARYNLGRKYLSGSPGVPVDPKAAEKWLQLAAQQNFVPALFSIGQIYANGMLGEPDYSHAHTLFLQAAQQGYAPAQHAIGYLYSQGLGVPQNPAEAVKWYNLAASRNYADSHYNLAYSYERGLGVPQNLTAAINHYRQAAEFGHANAQYSLGVAYYEGKGVEVDFVEAYKWWNLAAVAGIAEAASSKNILERLMTPIQIEAGQQKSREFIPHTAVSVENARFVQMASATEVSDLKRIGTGFLVTQDGYILTTFRTIQGSNNINVLTEGGSFEAKIHRADPLKDLALLKINGSFRPLPLASAAGDDDLNAKFVAVGFDGQNQVQFNPKAAKGIIKALLGIKADPRQFTVEPKVSKSFGGAALVNLQGQVIAMMLADTEAPGPDAPASSGEVSFALKGDHLISFLRTMPEVNATYQTGRSAAAKISEEETLSRARAATTLLLVL